MTPLLIHIQPFDVAANARVDIRIGSSLEADAYGLNGQPWAPALIVRPQMSIEIMSTDLSGRVQVGRARFSMHLGNAGIIETRQIKWGGASVKIYSAKALAWPAVTELDGEIIDHSYDFDTGELTVTAEVSTSLIEKPLLTAEFDGSGGAGGDADKRGTLKPAGFGACENIPPVMFDATRNIGMIDGYANCTAITKLMEGASDMGARVADYANYAALAAAIDAHTIPPGRWGTCVAEGLIGLGAPPVGTIGVNATFGSNRLGAMMTRILSTHAGVAGGQIDSASFTALNTALNYPTSYWTANQVECKDLLERMARSGNATLLITFQRKVAVSRAVATGSVATLDRSGGQIPRCVDWKSLAPMKPVWRIKARAARPAQVLDLDQVNYVDTVIDRGAYVGATVYRAGNLVWLADKSSWLYTNATPGSGNAPPTWPTSSNSYWQNIAPPLNSTAIGVENNATAGDNLLFNSTLATDTSGYAQVNPSTPATRTAPSAGDPGFYWHATASSVGSDFNNGERRPIPAGVDSLFLSAKTRANLAGAYWQFFVYFWDDTGALIGSGTIVSLITATPNVWETTKTKIAIPAKANKWSAFTYSQLNGATTLDLYGPRLAVTESQADVTATAELAADKTVAADYTGAITSDNLAALLWSPKVFKGSVSVKGANTTTYSISDTSGVTSGTGFVVDNTNGSSSKGDITIASGTVLANTAGGNLTVVVDGTTLPKIAFRVTKNLAPAPSGGGGGGGGSVKTVTWSPGEMVGLNTTSYTTILTSIKTVTLASGESLYGTAAIDYFVSGYGGLTRDMTFKWRYAVAGSGSWNDFAAGITGTSAMAAVQTGPPDYETEPPIPGSVSVAQTKSGLPAGDYDIDLVAVCNTTGRTVSPSGYATVEAKV